jgi:hypothetical protein
MAGRSRKHVAGVIAIAVIAIVVVAVGWGSSPASISRVDAATVARAEGAFLKAWRKANVQAKDRCESGPAKNFERCFASASLPGERTAVATFTIAVEGVLADGVGSECAGALKGDLAEYEQIPYFPGEATLVCGDESRS